MILAVVRVIEMQISTMTVNADQTGGRLRLIRVVRIEQVQSTPRVTEFVVLISFFGHVTEARETAQRNSHRKFELVFH